jgi:hypothetical protein
MLLNICREKVAERDAAQARLAEVQFAATGAIERADKAEARVRELEAENRVLRRAHNGPGDLGHYNCAGEFVPPQEWVDAATGRDLRCLMECGLTWCRVNGDDAPEWLVQLDKGEAYTQFPTLAEAASAVRKWQAGQVPNGGPDGTRGYHDVAEFYPAQEPAPSPEDEARARIAAAGAKVQPACSVYAGAGQDGWAVMAADGTAQWANSLDLCAAFAEAHRVTQDTPCDAPEAPAEG